MHEAKHEVSPDVQVSTYFVRTGHVTRIKNFYCKTPDTHTRIIRSIADVTAEIFKIKNCSVGNLFKYTFYEGKKKLGELRFSETIELLLVLYPRDSGEQYRTIRSSAVYEQNFYLYLFT